MGSDLLFVLEILGTVAFAFSGAMLAIEKKMDIFGVAILGMTTAVGGGIIRDLILGLNPPTAFVRPVYALTAIAVSIIVFFPFLRNAVNRTERFGRLLLFVLDTVGLGLFTAAGIETAFSANVGASPFLLIFVGVVTGVGGGVMRDIFAREMPAIFVKHFYACASLLGAAAYTVTVSFLGHDPAMLVCIFTVITLRILAFRFKWNLPRPK